MTDFSDPDVIHVRREMRKLLDQYPGAFEFVVQCVQQSGDSWRMQFPPMEENGGRPQQVNMETLALLLADYRNRKGTKKSFLTELAANGCRYGNHYFAGKWWTVDAIGYQLKRAQRLAKEDPDFEDLVESWRDC